MVIHTPYPTDPFSTVRPALLIPFDVRNALSYCPFCMVRLAVLIPLVVRNAVHC